MKYINILWLVFIFISCQNKSASDKEIELAKKENELLARENDIARVKNQQIKETSEKNIAWNYKGDIGGLPIKLQLNFENNKEGASWWHPLNGYYFYENKKILIKITGCWHQGGQGIEMTEFGDNGQTATFQGQSDEDNYLNEIHGIWKGNNKELNFSISKR